MYGTVVLAHAPSPSRPHPAVSPLDRQLIASNVELPVYVRNGVEDYMIAHEGSTLRTVVLEGFRALGIAIEDEDMIPERAMRTPRKRTTGPDHTDASLRPTSIRVPRYVRRRAEDYLLGHPQMRFRHLVMAGFRELGIEVHDEDLVAERQNVLAAVK